MDGTDSRDQDTERLDPTLFLRVLAVAQAVAFAFLFLAVLTAPLADGMLGGTAGADAVPRFCLLLVFLSLQRAWLNTSRFFERPRKKVDAPWSRFVLLCLFAITVNWFVSGFRDPESWGLVTGHDQPQYYVYLHSGVFDRDMAFANEYAMIPGIENMYEEMHPDDPGYNVAPVGSAVIWLPFYLAGHAVLKTLSGIGIDVPTDGMAAPYATATAFGNIVYAWLGAVLIFVTLRKWSSQRAALFTTLLIWVATPLLWYLVDEAWMSHGPSFFAGALVFYLWQRNREGRPHLAWALWGASLGLALMVRPSHAVLFALPLGEAIAELAAKRELKNTLTRFAGFMAAFLIAFAPQLLAWYVRSGLEGPPGSPMQWKDPSWSQVLFSAQHGLISWHPIALLGFLGIPLLWRASPRSTILLAVVIGLYWYSNAAIVSWWGGTSFGMRRFTGTLPFFAPGIALSGTFLIRVMRTRPWLPACAFVLVLFAYNGQLLKQFREHWFDPGPPVVFEGVWSVAAAQFQNGFGHPFSYPANLIFARRHGVSPSQYDILGAHIDETKNLDVSGRRVSTYLTYGWLRRSRDTLTPPSSYRAKSQECGLILPLTGDTAYTLFLGLTIPKGMTEKQEVSFVLNGKALGSATLSQVAPTNLELALPKDATRDGLNHLGLSFSSMYSVPWGERTPYLAKGLEIEVGRPMAAAAYLSSIKLERLTN